MCDPACGSGSLLLRFAKIIGQENVKRGYFGQEINLTTYNLARINMFLHGVGFEHFDIALGDTLTDPKHWGDEPFEAIVSNPPYSTKWEGKNSAILVNDKRFAPAGVLAPPSNNNFVDAIIQLPPDLFFGTSISTCIMVLKKSKPDSSVLFIDASAEFERHSTKNQLMENHREKILDAFTAREDVDHFARLVKPEEIAENDYILSVTSYVEPEDTREIIDIEELNANITKIVARQQELRDQIDEIVADLEVAK